MAARDLSERGTASTLRRYECAVCWEVYDPAQGDPVWQVPPGTPFEHLPAHWSCPVCAAERERFLEVRDE